jgi:UrcA family protein
MSSRTTSSRRITRLVVAAIIATVAGVPASFAQVASNDSDAQSVTVKYSDLNLATPEGSRTLYHRLVVAARSVCPVVGHPTELRRNRDVQRCISASVQTAVKQVRNPQLAQLAESQMR